MLEKLTKLFLLAVAAVLVVAVTSVDPLAEPVRAHHKAGHGGGGDGGGGDTNTDIVVDTTITDGNVLSSDGLGVYIDGILTRICIKQSSRREWDRRGRPVAASLNWRRER